MDIKETEQYKAMMRDLMIVRGIKIIFWLAIFTIFVGSMLFFQFSIVEKIIIGVAAAFSLVAVVWSWIDDPRMF